LSGRCTGASLTAAGCAQARGLAGQFARSGPVAAIHSSPRLRARETAEAIAARLGLQVELADALDEIDFGEWTGRTFAELDGDPVWAAWNTRRAIARAPAGESMAEAVSRAVMHIDRLASRDLAGAVVCVSHCDIIRGVVAHYVGLGLDRILAFDVDPGSVTTLLVGDWGGRLLTLNRESL
jgi:broad specificity phosphatase PhoE